MLSRRALLHNIVLAGLTIGAGAALAGCSSGSGRGGGPEGDIAMSDVQRISMSTDRTTGAAMLAALAGDLLRQVLVAERGNVIFSPWSIAVAMAMNRAGARGDTATQIDAALHVPAAPGPPPVGVGDRALDGRLDQALNTGAQVLDSRNEKIEEQPRTGEVSLRSANSTWARPDIAWKQDYLDTLAKYYGSGVNLTDFGGDPEGSRERINAWVADHTGDRITELVPQGLINSSTALAVVNAVYFKAPWAQAFPKGRTAPKPFTRTDGTTTQTPMMHDELDDATGFTGPGHQGVTIPYLGGKVALTAILPLVGQESAVAAWLSDGGIAAAFEQQGRRTVEVTMPTFAFTTTVPLKPVLQSLGIIDAFVPGTADYTDMTETTELFISAALHQATIAVDEEGTEATAATAIVSQETSARAPEPEPQVIVLDRPFYLIIHDLESRIPIFVGRVTDPTQRS